MTNIQPGPELDRTIEMKVFKSVVWEETRGEYKFIWFRKSNWEPNVKEVARYRKIQYSEIDFHKHIVADTPEYSTTWNGMKMVVEEMQRRGWQWQAGSNDDGTFCCEFDALLHGKGVVCETGTTAPHAVCMAALSALEGQEDERR